MGAKISPTPSRWLSKNPPANIREIPAAGTGPTSLVESATANAFGAWTQLIAATAADALIVGVNFIGQNLGWSGYRAVQIGIGAAAAEQVAMELAAGSMAGTAGGTVPSTISELPFPIFVPAGSRIAVRARGSSGSAQGAASIVLLDVADLTVL